MKESASEFAACKGQTAKRDAAWHGDGKPPKNKKDRIIAIQTWDAMPKDERPKLEDWLIDNFGTDPAMENPNVPISTFYGWRKLKKP